jgi:hypothetical protein
VRLQYLGYAATAYGVQGVTAPGSHTVLSGSINAAGVYVGLTRGRTTNLLHVVAEGLGDAEKQFIDAMGRDRADRGLQAATRQAAQDVSGLAGPGTAEVVGRETARLQAVIERADANAERWRRAADVLARQAHRHQHARDRQQAALDRARSRLQQTVTAAHGAFAADTAARRASLFGRRAAKRAADTAQAGHRDMQARVRQRWGSAPTSGGAPSWVEAVATRAADATPEVVAARADADQATASLRALGREQECERRSARAKIHGPGAKYRASSGAPAHQADQWRRQADAARADLTRLQAMPLPDAARLIERDNAARAQAQARRKTADSVRKTPDPRTQPRCPPPQQRGPSLGL